MFTFSRSERLKSRKTIGLLFRDGQSYMAYPLRVVWLPVSPEVAARMDTAVQIAISVPKRSFKTAVARNRIKRLIREAYRLNKHLLYEKLAGTEQRYALMLMYIAKEELPLAEITGGVKKMAKKFTP